VLECWNVGVLDCWSIGLLECWTVELSDSLQQKINFTAFQINQRLVTNIEMVVHLPHEELKETAVDSVTNIIDQKGRDRKELVQNHFQWRASI